MASATILPRPAIMQAGLRVPPVVLTQAPDHPHQLPMRAHTAIQNARARLMDMATQCMNSAPAPQSRAIGDVLENLREALREPLSCTVRGRIALLLNQFSALRIDAARLSMQELATRYSVAEMRLAVLILNNHDGGQPS